MRKLPVWLTQEEVNRVVEVSGSIRNRIIIKTFYYTGLRVAELLNIKVKDINFKEAYIFILGKGSKERYQPIPSVFLKELKSFVEMLNKQPEDYVFTNPQGNRLTSVRVWQFIKEAGVKAGLDKDIHPHTLRHSYATKVWEETGDLKKVQDLLDHQNLQTTAIYTHMSSKRKKDVANDVFREGNKK